MKQYSQALSCLMNDAARGMVSPISRFFSSAHAKTLGAPREHKGSVGVIGDRRGRMGLFGALRPPSSTSRAPLRVGGLTVA